MSACSLASFRFCFRLLSSNLRLGITSKNAFSQSRYCILCSKAIGHAHRRSLIRLDRAHHRLMISKHWLTVKTLREAISTYCPMGSAACRILCSFAIPRQRF